MIYFAANCPPHALEVSFHIEWLQQRLQRTNTQWISVLIFLYLMTSVQLPDRCSHNFESLEIDEFGVVQKFGATDFVAPKL